MHKGSDPFDAFRGYQRGNRVQIFGATCSACSPFSTQHLGQPWEWCESMWRVLSQHTRHASLKGVTASLKYPPTSIPSSNSILEHCFPISHTISIPIYRRYTNSKVLNHSDAQRETIYALSTPPGKAGVAVVRISGPDSQKVWQSMVKPYSSKNLPEPWKMERCHVTNPQSGEIIDDGLSVFFKGKC